MRNKRLLHFEKQQSSQMRAPKLIPTGVITLLEFLIAKFFVVSQQMRDVDVIIVKLERWAVRVGIRPSTQ